MTTTPWLNITKGITYMRAGFSVTVLYNNHSDHISFHDIVCPADASKEVKEKFLEEAETAMNNLLIKDKSYLNYSGYVGG